MYSAAVWYYNHLAGTMNVVMITEKPDTVARYSCLNSGVFVITLQVHTGRSLLEFCISNQVVFYYLKNKKGNALWLYGELFLEVQQE